MKEQLSIEVVNIRAKGEIAHYRLQQSLKLTLSHVQTPLQQADFENLVTKGEIAQNKQFLL